MHSLPCGPMHHITVTLLPHTPIHPRALTGCSGICSAAPIRFDRTVRGRQRWERPASYDRSAAASRPPPPVKTPGSAAGRLGIDARVTMGVGEYGIAAGLV